MTLDSSTPDRILFNGRIAGPDEQQTPASALAVAGGRILAVGTDQDMQERAGADTETIDLEGRLVVPGGSGADSAWAAAAGCSVERPGPSVGRAGLRAYLGTIPDYVATERPGLALSGANIPPEPDGDDEKDATDGALSGSLGERSFVTRV